MSGPSSRYREMAVRVESGPDCGDAPYSESSLPDGNRLHPRPNKMQDHRHDRRDANATPKHSQHPANDKLRGEAAGVPDVIGGMLHEENNPTPQPELARAPLTLAQ